MSSTPEQLLDHEYDGIREYDNPTPGWWHALFVGTVVFSLFYWAFFSFSPMVSTPEQKWAQRQTSEFKRIFGSMGVLQPDAKTIHSLSSDTRLMQVATGMFQGNCASCHGKDGGGINGVNLCDDSYKNVRKIEDLYTVITNGAGNGAMPAQGNRYSQNERVLLAAYVASLRGTKPATPKAPEGEVIPPWSVTK